VIGRLSDQFGRRRLLLLSQAGTCLGFIVLGNADALWMVYLGRVLDGITAGNLSTAQAYISDHTEPQNRAKAFGIIGIAFGIGFSFGPAMAGWLGGYGYHVPFLAAACLSAGSMICTYTLLEPGAPGSRDSTGVVPEARLTGPGGKRPGLFDLAVYLDYFRRPGLGALYLQFFLFTFAFSAFMSGFALFAERRFSWTVREVGYMFTYSGILGMLVQGGLLGRLVKRFGEARLVVSGFVTIMIAYVLLGFAETLAMLVVLATIAAYGTGVLRPVLTSQLTQKVGRHEQGVALGISASLSSLAMTLAPPAGGSLLDHHWLVAWALVPASAAALGLLVALINRPGRTGAAPRVVGAAGSSGAPDVRPGGAAGTVDAP